MKKLAITLLPIVALVLLRAADLKIGGLRYLAGKQPYARIHAPDFLPRPLFAQMMQPIVAGPQMSSLGVGLVGWWKFDEGTGSTAYDSSGKGNTGTWNGTQTGTSGYYSPGKVGPWCGTFDGSTNYVEAPNAVCIGLSAAAANTKSVTFWAKGSGYSPVSNARASTACGDAHIDIESSGSITYSLDSNTYLPYVYSVTSTATSNVSVWNFYAVTLALPENSGSGDYSGPVTLSVNGTTESYTLSYAVSGAITYNTVDIGRHYNSIWETFYFAGLIDDVRIYNRALSGTEIQELYRSQR